MNTMFIFSAAAALVFGAAANAQVVPRRAVIEHNEYSTKFNCEGGLPGNKIAAFKEYSFYEMPNTARKVCDGEPFNLGENEYEITCKVDRLDDERTLYVHRLVARARAICVSK